MDLLDLLVGLADKISFWLFVPLAIIAIVLAVIGAAYLAGALP